MQMKFRCVIIAIAAIAVTMMPAMAFGYAEGGSVDPAKTTCVSCHGATSSPATTATVETSRTGPHGGYKSSTTKCGTCHEIHKGAVGGAMLLPRATIKDTCNTCHDGTGGQGVYGVLAARGYLPSEISSHSIDSTNNVPGGNAATGLDATMAFSGEPLAGGGRGMTCTDCHSPHGSSVVAPFIGDRRRTATDTNVASIATSRLLRKNPGGSDNTVTVYGSEWCGGCHAGRLSTSGLHNHPVETSMVVNPFNYGSIWRIKTSVSPTSAPAANVANIASNFETGPLGGNNNGYLMLEPRTWTGTHYPICQQCHEDPRFVGTLDALGANARVGTYTVTSANGTNTADSPRVQVFPHETTSTRFLIEQGDDLCTNCHPGGNLP